MFEFNPPLRVERNYFRKALIKTKFLREFCHVFVKIKINICEKFRGNLRRNVFAKIQAGINSPQLYSPASSFSSLRCMELNWKRELIPLHINPGWGYIYPLLVYTQRYPGQEEEKTRQKEELHTYTITHVYRVWGCVFVCVLCVHLCVCVLKQPFCMHQFNSIHSLPSSPLLCLERRKLKWREKCIRALHVQKSAD